MDQSLLGAVGAGILSFLSPCILPLVPAYLCFLTGMELDALGGGEPPGDNANHLQAARTIRLRAVGRALFFVLGFATIFISLGATATTLGRFVATWFDTLAVVAGLLIIIMGLHFLGVVRIGVLYREARFQTRSDPVGPLGAYVVGLAFAFGWTPCVGPVLAAILATAGAQESLWRGTGLLAGYAAGIGIPFLLAAFFVGPFLSFMNRFRRYMQLVEKIMGAALVVTGILFITGGMPMIGNWLLETFPLFGKIG